MSEITIDRIWHYPLFKMGNNEIIPSNLVAALIMLWIGTKYYKPIVSKLHLYVTGYLCNDPATALVFQRIISYLMIFIYGIFVLDLANIPISTFAFLGGTIGLSIGLGAQTLIGNFLSGLLVIIEKSLKIGDIVEIDKVVGIVESIGIRSTAIKTFCNARIIMPNSNFVHGVFVKLKTYKDFIETKAYLEIEIGNMDEIEVKQRILGAINSIDIMMDNHAPAVYLSEIHDTKYHYSIYFYHKIFYHDHDAHHMEYIYDQINTAMKKQFSYYNFSLKYLYEHKKST